MASSLYRLMADRSGGIPTGSSQKVFRNLLDVSATVIIQRMR